MIKGQGAIEYLLIIGAAVIIAVIVIALMMGLAGTGTTNVESAGTDDAYLELRIKSAKLRGNEFMQAHKDTIIDYSGGGGSLEDIIISDLDPLSSGTTITIEQEDGTVTTYNYSDGEWEGNISDSVNEGDTITINPGDDTEIPEDDDRDIREIIEYTLRLEKDKWHFVSLPLIILDNNLNKSTTVSDINTNATIHEWDREERTYKTFNYYYWMNVFRRISGWWPNDMTLTPGKGLYITGYKRFYNNGNITYGPTNITFRGQKIKDPIPIELEGYYTNFGIHPCYDSYTYKKVLESIYSLNPDCNRLLFEPDYEPRITNWNDCNASESGTINCSINKTIPENTAMWILCKKETSEFTWTPNC